MSRSLLLLSLFCCSPLWAALDPTQPPLDLRPAAAAGSEAAPSPQLQAILRGAGSTRAVISGRTVQVGDVLNDAKVVAIYPHAVLLERQGQQELLRLVEPILKPSR